MDKDLHAVSSYAMNPSMFRQVDSFANIPPHMIRMPQFHAAALPVINPGGGGAFRPVLTAGEQDSYHSAFRSAKRTKTNDEGPQTAAAFPSAQNIFPESTVVKQELLGETGESESTERSEGLGDSHSERSSPEEDGRSLRRK